MKASEITSQLIGEKCWRAWRGAGYTVYLELGEKLPNVEGQKELKKGTYSIGLTACPWEVFQEDKLLFGTDSSFPEIEEGLKIFLNKKVENVEVDETIKKAKIKFLEKVSIHIDFAHERDGWVILTPKEEVVVNKDAILIEQV